MMNEGKRTVIAYWEETGWEHGLLWGKCARLVEAQRVGINFTLTGKLSYPRLSESSWYSNCNRL